MMKVKMTETDAEREARWQAEEDARVLKRAMEIEKDKVRKSNAKKIISNELSTLKKLVGEDKKPKAQPKKTPVKKQTGKKK